MTLIVHAHIPKTGGTALNHRLFFRRFAESERALFYRADLHAIPYALSDAAHALRGKSFAAGHIPIGFFDRVAPATYVSTFREPVERYLSFASFVVTAESHSVVPFFDSDIRPMARVDADRFVRLLLDNRRVALRQSNAMTRLMSHHTFLGAEFATSDDLTVALRNLRRADFSFGLQERFDEFAGALCGAFGWPEQEVFDRDPSPSLHARDNRFDFRIRRTDLTAGTIDLIRKGQDLDIRLYDEANRVLAGRAAKLATGGLAALAARCAAWFRR